MNILICAINGDEDVGTGLGIPRPLYLYTVVLQHKYTVNVGRTGQRRCLLVHLKYIL
jgi:hypothetical protein